MAQRKSTGLVNFMADSGSARSALGNARMFVYTGTQPSSADEAITGTLLVTLTKESGVFTAETLPQWKFTLAGASGSVNSIKIGGVECLSTAINYITDLTTTAAAVAANITAAFTVPDFRATSSAATITITGPVGAGEGLNTQVVVVTNTTLTTTYDDTGHTGAVFTTGVSCVNGCNFQFPAVSGILSKEIEDWSGVAVATGTAGYFRIEGDSADTKGVSTLFRRLDGSISTSGAELNLTTTAVTTGGTFAVNSGSFTVIK